MGRLDRTFGTSGQEESSVFNFDPFGRVNDEAHNLTDLPAMTSGQVRGNRFERYRQQGTDWQSRTFDGANNWTSLETPVNGLEAIQSAPDNSLASFGSATITTDPSGRVLDDGEGTTYAYDGLGALMRVERGGQVWSFSYDAFSRLTVLKTPDGQQVQQHFGQSVLRHIPLSGGEETFYVPSRSMTPAGFIKGEDAYTLHQGWGQRIEAVASESGNLVERVEYDAFGQPDFFDAGGLPIEGSGVGLDVLTTGQTYLPGLALHRFGHRWYRPQWGRFLTSDPAGFADGPNTFSFVGNQPLAFMDPSGLGKVPSSYGLRRWLGGLAGGFIPPRHKRAFKGGVNDRQHRSSASHMEAYANFDRTSAARVDELGEDAQFWATQGLEISLAGAGVIGETVPIAKALRQVSTPAKSGINVARKAPGLSEGSGIGYRSKINTGTKEVCMRNCTFTTGGGLSKPQKTSSVAAADIGRVEGGVPYDEVGTVMKDLELVESNVPTKYFKNYATPSSIRRFIKNSEYPRGTEFILNIARRNGSAHVLAARKTYFGQTLFIDYQLTGIATPLWLDVGGKVMDGVQIFVRIAGTDLSR